MKGKITFFSYFGSYKFSGLTALMAVMLLNTGCGKKISAGNFDSESWKSDKMACLDRRKTLIPELEKLKPELVGINEKDLEKILGKPDANGLADQGEHFYYYYLETGAQCKYPTMLSSANKLIVRVNALDLVTEANYEQPLNR